MSQTPGFSLPRIISLFAALLVACSQSAADAPDPDPGRFAEEIAAFAAWDAKNSTPKEPILFVGSSSIRFWETSAAFPGRAIVNRGFGGSEYSDLLHYYDELILQYAPFKIFVYEGDNDIARGKTPEQVVDDYRELRERIAADLPGTWLYVISIKPSRARWDDWPAMQAANAAIRADIAERERVTYVDLAAPLLDDDGEPLDVFIADGLHLNERGYALWNEALEPFLD